MATFDSTKLPRQDILADIVKGKVQRVSAAKSFPVGAGHEDEITG